MALKKPGKQFQDEPCPLAKHNKGCMVGSARSNPVDIFALGIGYHKQPPMFFLDSLPLPSIGLLTAGGVANNVRKKHPLYDLLPNPPADYNWWYRAFLGPLPWCGSSTAAGDTFTSTTIWAGTIFRRGIAALNATTPPIAHGTGVYEARPGLRLRGLAPVRYCGNGLDDATLDFTGCSSYFRSGDQS